jgi:hypothetical protein
MAGGFERVFNRFRLRCVVNLYAESGGFLDDEAGSRRLDAKNVSVKKLKGLTHAGGHFYTLSPPAETLATRK